ncbi:MAG: tRNA lysidine(34) synthetase TilS [Paludibacter sp.]|jgi:tRNA(Ile)-lysidine synthase|nr:tRNA lysidine(34) synthetase TilS [Paludibacter sp.]
MKSNHLFTQKVEKYIKNQRLIDAGAKVIIGVSGGADSTALLYALQSLGYDCVVAHCNFQLRDKEADRDEQFVKNLAENLKLPIEIIRFDTKNYAATNNISIEMAARDLRYNFFDKLTDRYNAKFIAVAHHADDNIETMLLNLIRGTGIAGLKGMPIRNGKVVRPLLCCNRTEILQFLAALNIKYVEDSSNREEIYKRNRIRNIIIPELEKINPAVRQTLYESISVFDETRQIFDIKIAEIKAEIITQKDNNFEININKIKDLPYKDTVLYEILSEFGFNKAQISEISECLTENSGQIFYSKKYKLLHNRDLLTIQTITDFQNIEVEINENQTQIALPIRLKISAIDRTDNFIIPRHSDVACLDAAKVKFPLTIRQWHEGDWFIPYGMKNRKKLSDFFIDNKISRFEKEKIFVILSQNRIVWIAGLRIDNEFCITKNTKKILKIELY